MSGGAIALASVLAFGAAQLAAPDQADAAAPSAATDVPILDGYQPSWLDWTDLTCGMSDADLRSSARGWSARAAGDVYGRTSDFGGDPTTSWSMAAKVREGQGSLDVTPVLVWSQDGVVVDLGPNVFDGPGPQSEPLLGAGRGAIEAQAAAYSTCVPTETETGDRFQTPLPEGNYEVRVVAFPETRSGRWDTVVSKPVPVRIDADGAHSPVGDRGGDAATAPVDQLDGEITRFDLDRSTEWVSAGQTQRGYSSDTPMRIEGICESSDPEDLLPVEVVLPSTGEVLASTQVTCDGLEAGSEVGVLAGGEEVVDLRLPRVPDGVARASFTLASATPGGPAGECSATGMTPLYPDGNAPTEGAAAAAASIVTAALDCDSEALVALAADSGTELMFGTETPEQTFALPEAEGVEHYRSLVALLGSTRPAVAGGDPANQTVVWPRVATQEFRDSDEAWQEVVDAGILTQEQADAQRADETFGYTGMVVGIAENGTWRYYSSTD
ncbi:hypothetical protein ACIG47_02795 [Promicromonospora sp. NPDC052451]|uniref:hypothetical protein n=1 Tax=Promicromonospora sp. NPDC052451 TaxID=3364407 RepID=UPI0037CB6911